MGRMKVAMRFRARATDRPVPFIRRMLHGALAMVLALPGASIAEQVFTSSDILDWEPHVFADRTHYERVETDSGPAVHAVCQGGGASGLYRRQRIDLSETPVIEWRWRVDETAHDRDETQQSGDDYAARLYVVHEYDLLVWRTRAINYVWAANQPKGSDWPNAYQSRAHVVAVRSGTDEGDDRWRTQRRNLRKDFRRFHDRELGAISAVAIMTDCDDTGKSVEAWYGEIRFLPGDDS